MGPFKERKTPHMPHGEIHKRNKKSKRDGEPDLHRAKKRPITGRVTHNQIIPGCAYGLSDLLIRNIVRLDDQTIFQKVH